LNLGAEALIAGDGTWRHEIQKPNPGDSEHIAELCANNHGTERSRSRFERPIAGMWSLILSF
jgi:hypothetical protein